MGSWSRSGPRVAITCGRGGGAGFSRIDDTNETGEPSVPVEPNAVRNSVTTTVSEAIVTPTIRPVCRRAACFRRGKPRAAGRGRATRADRLRRFGGGGWGSWRDGRGGGDKRGFNRG